jgi:hypothetical protein
MEGEEGRPRKEAREWMDEWPVVKVVFVAALIRQRVSAG